MANFKPHNLFDRTYEIGIFLKGVDGVLEIIGEGLLYFVSPTAINPLVRSLTQRELAGYLHDLLAINLLLYRQHLALGGTAYGVIYLLRHGLIKLVVAAASYKNKVWAYPFALVTLSLRTDETCSALASNSTDWVAIPYSSTKGDSCSNQGAFSIRQDYESPLMSIYR